MSELQSHHGMFEQINHVRTTVHGHPQLSLMCRLPNRISFDVFDRCFCKVETRVCETLGSCAKRLGGLAVTTLTGASRSFNPALVPDIRFALRFMFTVDSVIASCCTAKMQRYLLIFAF